MNYTKFTRAQAMAVFRHCARDNKHYGNENIDHARTHENYDLGPGGNQWGRMEDRLKELTYRKQKNNTVLCSWVITAPKNLPEDKKKEFFKLMYDFMATKYGPDNVVSAHVHMDEAGPGHMHFLYVPGTQDMKLSAKRTTTRETLQHIHDEAQRVVDKYLGHDYLLRADDPAERAKKSVPVRDMKKALVALQTQIEAQRIENDFIQESQEWKIQANDKKLQEQSKRLSEGSRMAQEQTQLKQDIESLTRSKRALQADIKGIEEDFIARMEDIALHGELAQRELNIAILNGYISNEVMERIQNEINEGNEARYILQSLEDQEQYQDYEIDR